MKGEAADANSASPLSRSSDSSMAQSAIDSLQAWSPPQNNLHMHPELTKEVSAVLLLLVYLYVQ